MNREQRRRPGDGMRADSNDGMMFVAISTTSIVHLIGYTGLPACNGPRSWFVLEVSERSLDGVRVCNTCERVNGGRWSR